MNRRNTIAAVAVAVALFTAAGVHITRTAGQANDAIDDRSSRAAADLADRYPEPDRDGPVHALEPGEIMFVNRAPGDTYGQIGTLTDTGRTIHDLACNRVHAAADTLTCHRPATGLPAIAGRGQAEVATYRITGDQPDLLTTTDFGLASRARVSPDGTLAASTVFVRGHSYTDPGEFSTATTITEIAADGTTTSANLEDSYGNNPNGPGTIAALGGNYWGVTFAADNDTFYATLGIDNHIQLVQGQVSDRSIVTFAEGYGCPSLSPDGATIVAKVPDGDHLNLVAIDTATRQARPLTGETRSVDDHVEWLDNDTILYALPRDGEADTDPQPIYDIWSLDLTEGAEPRLYAPYASSPAVHHIDSGSGAADETRRARPATGTGLA